MTLPLATIILHIWTPIANLGFLVASGDYASRLCKRLEMTISTLIDLCLYATLFVLFMVFFGIPSIGKYQKKETIIISSKELTNGIEAPAITLG